MTIFKEIEKTTDLLCFLASTKEQEINSCVDKLLILKSAWVKKPSLLNELKYNLALERYGRLQADTVNINELEHQIEHLNNNLTRLSTKSA